MRLHGLIRTAELQESAPGSEQIEMILRIQGVGPGQPRSIIIPFAILLADPTLEPDQITGRAFEAEVEPDERGLFIASEFTTSSRMLRPEP